MKINGQCSETCTGVSQFYLSFIVGYIDVVPLLLHYFIALIAQQNHLILIVYYLLNFLAQGFSLILLKRNGLFFSY